MINNSYSIQTPLAVFVKERLAELDIRQSDFCRRNSFDQGLLSKIQNSQVNSLTIESVLKLAAGLGVPPQQVFTLIDRMDLHDLVVQTYARQFSEMLIQSIEQESPELAAAAQKVIPEAFPEAESPSVKIRRKRNQVVASFTEESETILKIGT